MSTTTASKTASGVGSDGVDSPRVGSDGVDSPGAGSLGVGSAIGASDSSAGAELITATPAGATLGAIVEGVDFDNLAPATAQRLNELILEHGVLVFEGVHATEEQQEAFARCFGTPYIYPLTRFTNPEGDIWTEFVDTPDSPPDADVWHTDLTWVPNQPKYGILSALDVPETGGDTMWADLYSAYDNLSPVMQEVCESLTVVHQIGSNVLDPVERQGGRQAADFLRDNFPGIKHPLVRTHPETGRKVLLLAGGFMKCIEGMNQDESDLLIGWLRGYINNPNFHFGWRWKQGDLAIWDERCTNHRGLSHHYPQYRRMRRCTVEGDGQFVGI